VRDFLLLFQGDLTFASCRSLLKTIPLESRFLEEDMETRSFFAPSFKKPSGRIPGGLLGPMDFFLSESELGFSPSFATHDKEKTPVSNNGKESSVLKGKGSWTKTLSLEGRVLRTRALIS